MIGYWDLTSTCELTDADYEHIAKQVNRGIMSGRVNNVLVEARCAKCGKNLYPSDVMDYDYECVDCGEHYYKTPEGVGVKKHVEKGTVQA